jgi:hypothetical protein
MYNLAINLFNLGMGVYYAIFGFQLLESGDYLLLEDSNKIGI